MPRSPPTAHRQLQLFGLQRDQNLSRDVQAAKQGKHIGQTIMNLAVGVDDPASRRVALIPVVVKIVVAFT